ncbi:hypothetical protein GOV03_04390 [Candidatus Woesearchaeota archaeon]|nr:hypothetical protein [Candidatus Woesearchaeota archaeon]
MNPNDEIRQNILQYFYDRNANATSKYGKKGSASKISNARKELKDKYGLKQNEVVSNLNYLIDQGWIKEIIIEKHIERSGVTIPSRVTWYEITAVGIDKIEGESEYQPADRFAGINIHASGENVITLGDGNIVNVHYQELHNELNNLKNEIKQHSEFTEAQKLDLVADIETIKDQLIKSKPDKTIVSKIWGGIEKVVTGANLIELITKVTPLINSLI